MDSVSGTRQTESIAIDLSGIEPIETARPWTGAKNPARRCTAHKKNGERCNKIAIAGGNVCTHHGGKARQVRENAQCRLAEAADLLANSTHRQLTPWSVWITPPRRRRRGSR